MQGKGCDTLTQDTNTLTGVNAYYTLQADHSFTENG